MNDAAEAGYQRIPGLFRLWDIPQVVQREDEWWIHYADLTEDGAPLFAVYLRRAGDAA